MTELITKNIEERNALIAKLYEQGVPYTYTDADKVGDYHIKYEETWQTWQEKEEKED